MRTRLLLWDEEEVRKKKTLVLVFAILLTLSLLGLYAATGPEGGLIAGVTPTVLPSPSAAVTGTSTVPTAMTTATPTASATPVVKITTTPVPPEPTVAPPATSIAIEPTATSTVAPAVPTSTATPTATSAVLEPTLAPTAVPTAPLAAPVITTPSDGSVLKDDRPTIAGSAPPSTTVQVYDDGTLIGTTTAGAQGNWTLPGETLEPGEHTVTAVASDDAGRTSAPSVAVTFTIVIEHLPTTGGSWFERWLDRLLSIALP